jgi:hypothetical protein
VEHGISHGGIEAEMLASAEYAATYRPRQCEGAVVEGLESSGRYAISGRDRRDRNAFCPFDVLLTSSKLMEGPWDC